MSAMTGRRLVRALDLPTTKGTAAAGKIPCLDSNTNLTGVTLTNPILINPTTQGTVSGVGLTQGGIASGSFSAASNTTPANITGMAATLAPGTYVFDIYLAVTDGATGGLKVNGTFSGTLTSFVADTWVYNTTTVTAEVNITSIASNFVSAAVAATAVSIAGTVVVATGGTFQLQGAQSVSNATAFTVANNSYIQFTRLS